MPRVEKAHVCCSTLAYRSKEGFRGELRIKTPDDTSPVSPVPNLFVPYNTDGKNVYFDRDGLLRRKNGEEVPYRLPHHLDYAPFVDFILTTMEGDWIRFFTSLRKISHLTAREKLYDHHYTTRFFGEYFRHTFDNGDKIEVLSGSTGLEVPLDRVGFGNWKKRKKNVGEMHTAGFPRRTSRGPIIDASD